MEDGNKDPDAQAGSQRLVGPRGGTTTITPDGMVKKNLWMPREMAERLREKPFEEHRSESDIMREGLRQALGRDCEQAAAETSTS